MKFREHGMGKPVLQFKDRAGLVAYLKAQFAPWPDLDRVDPTKIKTEPYGVFNTHQGPAGWTGKVWLVTLPEYGVVGYADEPISR
jgi:hypothetical protein